MSRISIASFVLAVAAPAPVSAQQAASLADRIINTPAPAQLRIGGMDKKPAVHDDNQVQGGKALRIEVPQKGANAYAVTAVSPITKAVRAGDALVLAFWGRFVEGEAGAATARLPSNAIRHAKAPYAAVVSGSLEIGPKWQLHEIRGTADRDYAAGELLVSLHLAAARQTIDLGPVFVLNMGQAAP